MKAQNHRLHDVRKPKKQSSITSFIYKDPSTTTVTSTPVWAKYRESVEQQLESNREFHSRQMTRLRGEIEQKQKQIDTLRERNTEISSETDRLKVWRFLTYRRDLKP